MRWVARCQRLARRAAGRGEVAVFDAAQGDDAGAQPGVGGEDAVIAVAVDAGRRNEGGKGGARDAAATRRISTAQLPDPDL